MFPIRTQRKRHPPTPDRPSHQESWKSRLQSRSKLKTFFEKEGGGEEQRRASVEGYRRRHCRRHAEDSTHTNLASP